MIMWPSGSCTATGAGAVAANPVSTMVSSISNGVRVRAASVTNSRRVGIVHRDHPRGVADRMRAGGTRRDDRVVRPHQAVFDRDLTRDQVDQPTVNEMGADAARPLFVEHENRKGVVWGKSV